MTIHHKHDSIQAGTPGDVVAVTPAPLPVDLSRISRLQERQALKALLDEREAVQTKLDEAPLTAAYQALADEWEAKIDPVRRQLEELTAQRRASLLAAEESETGANEPLHKRINELDEAIAETGVDTWGHEILCVR